MDPRLKDIRIGLRRIGRGSAPEDIVAASRLFVPLHEREPYVGVRIVRDRNYGPHPRHRLDLFLPEAVATAPRPVLAFVHGGGFSAGDKKFPGSPFHDNVGVWAVRNGLVGVNLTYRLTPEVGWPSGIEDLTATMDWLRHEIGAHGGDPARIFLLGTSAGAVHVATYLVHNAAHAVSGASGPAVAGAILLSGLYDFTAELDNPLLAAYLGPDPRCYAERSVIDGLASTPVPLLVTLSEHDPLDFERQALLLLNAFYRQHGCWPNFIRLLGHSHFTGTLQLNTVDDYFGTHLREFIECHSGGVGTA
ncbi:MAG: alpha/beta hydrolase [Gammaproteobacteria bacterium]|nr:alpha/beta hydrolase [Gammaproteobacteria bacterium]